MKRVLWSSLLLGLLLGTFLPLAQAATPVRAQQSAAIKPPGAMAETGRAETEPAAMPTFATLVEAVEAAGLYEVLADPEARWTIFAPTDAAFAALPDGVLEMVLADQALLTRILTYHVIEGIVTSEQLTTMMAPTMEMAAVGGDLLGGELNVQVTDNGILVNNSTILQADIAASNGVIHVIDRVLLPPDVAAMVGSLMAHMPLPMGAVETAAALTGSDFTIFVDALTTTGLLDLLADPDLEVTIFAPTDAAFATLPEGVLERVLHDPALLTRILTYHVVEGIITSDQFATMMAPTLEMAAVGGERLGGQLQVQVSDDGVMVNNAQVVLVDIMASNGVVHVVDQVLLPPDVAAMIGGMQDQGPNMLMITPPASVADVVAANPSLSILLTAVNEAGLVEVLRDPNAEYTIFAPSNTAFAALPEGVLERVLADPELLTRILTYHVVEGRIKFDDLTTMMAPTMEMASVGGYLLGGQLDVQVSHGDATINGANIMISDIAAGNGVVHIIDTVLLPPDVAAMLVQ